MSNVDIGRFEEFFYGLWKQRPFAWQTALAERVMGKTERPWPEVIALPTASGKTACLDIAVFSLAAQATLGEQRTPIVSPRRIFFVVDRRVIVDEAFERAKKMAAMLACATDGILKDVADSLRKIAAGPTPLECFELRGGMYRSDAWAKSPLQPSIIASTVDQIGSRLLFRAYGRSHKAWPIQAGLAANDSLILLDEAHCSVPFMETIRSIAKYRDWAENPLSPPFFTSIMSATPPAGMTDVFYDKSDERLDTEHPLGKRQQAAKPAHLQVVDKATGKNAEPEMAAALAKSAEDLAMGRKSAVVVFTNRVRIAREAFRILRDKHHDDVILLTGRMRPFDKDDVVKNRLTALAASAATSRKLERSVFVVATQTLEVGADLDFDAMATECASLDALRQRFGRLNRMGRDSETKAVVLVSKDHANPKDDDSDPVYGKAIFETWKWLSEKAGTEGIVDFGISSMDAMMSQCGDLSQLNAPVSHAPVMLPSHVDCWVQTAPEPLPSPDVSLFLHGTAKATADVHVCWRADLDLADNESTLKSLEVLTLCPPAAAECLPVPIWVMRDWLLGENAVDVGADVEGEQPPDNKEAEESVSLRPCVRWRGRDETKVVTDPRDIRPGDVLIIPSTEDGWATLGDFAHYEECGPILDYGDRAFAQIRGKAILRLNPKVIAQWPPFKEKLFLTNLADDAERRWEDDADGLLEEISESLEVLVKDNEAPSWLRTAAQSLVDDPCLRRLATIHPLGGLILRGNRRLPNPSEGLDLFSDEDDAAASGTIEVSLSEHLQGVQKMAQKFVSGIALPDVLSDAVVKAAGLHDAGKVDSRFQSLLRGGNPWMSGTIPLAKSAYLPQGRADFQKAQRASGFPQGARHELLSVRLVESNRSLLPIEQELADLVLHLIASHHGHCRPFAPIVIDTLPVNASLTIDGCELEAKSATGLERMDSGVAERFWKLTRRYGWWGLAWLETMVRLADHRQSELEELQKRGER